MLHLCLGGAEPGDKGMPLTQALKEVGVARATWYTWEDNGYIDVQAQRIHGDRMAIIHEEFLPHYREAIRVLVSLALGRAPEGSDLKRIQPADALNAAAYLVELLFEQTERYAAGTAALQVLENYEPQRMLVNNTFREGEPEPPDFVYRGMGDGPRMGQFEPLSDEELEQLDARPEVKLENIDLDKLFSVLRPEDRRKAGLDRGPGTKKPA